MTVETLLEKRKSLTRRNRRKTLKQYFVVSLLQKQSPESSVKKVFLKFSQNYWRTPALESLFNIKNRLQHRCFLVTFAKFLEYFVEYL